jgi:hypothetical protein
MKTLIYLLIASVSLVSCVDYYETVYDERDRVVGSYDVDEYSNTHHEYVYYSMYVSKSHRSGNELILDNFYAEDLAVRAYISNGHITIPFQVIDGYEIEGTGSYYRGEMDLNYSVRDRYSNNHTDFCETIAHQL